MTADQYTELVAFIGRKFEEQERRTLVLLEQAANERRILAEGTEARMGTMEARLDGIDGRFDGVDTRLDRIDARLGRVDARLDRVDARLDTMNEGFGGRLASIEGWIRARGSE
ncbi:hypothetical protein [Gaopeijia maritima]|uniref:hypothetical protein n=1 Tax=Gaopeijia maritima TaxID=3119007 RepID=UPI00328C38E8